MRISMWPFMLALVGLCGFAPLPASAAYVISIGGGHCNQIGEWDAPSLTCTLTRDVEDGIVITNGAIVTLDGAGHVIFASDFSGYGVHVHENSPHVTIRNVVIKDASFGIYFERADSGRVENSMFRNTNVGIDFFDATSFVVEDSVFERSDDDFSTYAITSSFTEGTVIRDNHISSVSTAIKVDSDPATLIEGNTITNGGRGIHLYRLDNALVVKNVVSEMQLEGLYLEESFRNQIRENTFQDSSTGAYLFFLGEGGGDGPIFSFEADSPYKVFVRTLVRVFDAVHTAFLPSARADVDTDTVFSSNNFIRNETHVGFFDAIPARFSLPLPNGGNYWDTFDEEDEGCVDGNFDGFCDSAYDLFGMDILDEHPRVVPFGTPLPEPSCCSSVMFLPGAKGSRLYESDTRRWEPVGNTDVAQLSLNVVGSSVSSNIRTRRHDVIQSAYELMDIYDDFVGDMYTLFDEAGIGDFEAVTYDWRLSLNEIVNKGAESNGYISYTTATNTPYIEQTLRRLAGNSPTGKATIVAHSNGGLVAKALMQKLGAAETAALIDKVIFVGVPQSGAPQAVGTLLYGYGEALPFDSCWTWLVIVRDLCSVLVDRPTARTFAENAPVSYHLLPSQAYFDAVQHDGVHPVVQFPALQAYSLERGAYGDVIGDVGELHHFLRASEGGRSKPNQADTQSANVLSAPLLAYAANTHAMLDAWIPPEGVDVYQIAGWGNDTVSGIEFYDEPRVFGLLPGRVPKYKPVFVEDGDGVVPVPSALMMAEDDNVKRYWVNLDEHDSLLAGGLDHAKIFRMDELRDFLTSIILDGVTELPQFITTSAPDPLSLQKKLRFILHSPLTLELSDEEGNRVGYAEDGSFDYEIPNVTYGEFGEVKYLIAPAGTKYTVSLQGQDFGEFSLDIQEVEQGEVVSQSTIAGVPATPNTFAFLTIENGIEDASPLFVDEGGDGVSDIELLFEQGEVVVHESQASTAPSSSSTSSTSSSISLIQPLLAHLPPLMIPNIPPVIAIVPDVQHQAEQDILMLDEREAKESVMAESERGDETHTPFLERLFKILYTLWEYVKQIPSFLFG